MASQPECVYCGTTESITDEHAPPKLIFAEPRPSDLITVPACEKCNGDGSKDAEYFRLCLCLNSCVKDLPSVEALKPTLQRSMKRPQAKGFREASLNAFARYNDGFLFTVDMRRIHLVVRRTVECLYWHETGKRLPERYRTSAVSLELLGELKEEKQAEFIERFVIPLTKEKLHVVAGNQFAYSVIHTSRPFVSVWSLLFYGRLPFVVFTGRMSELPSSDTW